MRVATQVNLTKKLIKEKRNHTNTHKQTTKAIHPCVFNARVHYTVLTQHPNHTLPTRAVSARLMVRHKKRGIMPQTPNNAPTYKQLLFTVHGQRVSQSAIQTLSSSHQVCVSPGQFFNNKSWQHDTRILNQPRVQLHPKNKSSLERR